MEKWEAKAILQDVCDKLLQSNENLSVYKNTEFCKNEDTINKIIDSITKNIEQLDDIIDSD